MATITLTGKNSREVAALGAALVAGASSYSGQTAVGTVTATDASPMVVTFTDSRGNVVTSTI